MDDVERLTLIRAELRFELGLLHDRVNALLARPGVTTTARLVLDWTQDQEELLTRASGRSAPAGELPWRVPGAGALQASQRRSLLFFRAVPAVFAVVWTVLTVVALVLTW